MLPFEEKVINENTVLREFKNTSVSDEQMWHRDTENRVVTVLESGGWSFQMDNSLPHPLSEGDEIYIPKETWHRVIQGEGVLKVKVIKENLEEAEFSYMIAQAAVDGKKEIKIGDKTYPVKMSKDKAQKILDEKDDAISENKKSNHDPNYKAPEGSKRDKQLDQTKEDLKRAKKLRKDGKSKQAKELEQRAYRRRARMEKQEREKPGYKNKPRKDTKKESIRMTEASLREVIRNILSEELSKKTKETLKKKAEKRGLTPSSVYAEFKKGLAAYASSGSRKGMSAHQWAHARVNSATPSKSWAVVKKSKKKKKK
tara:strand:+ start:106 stop:1044 length:939 start_codon:yes stop_codon:yes gene_type:complete